MKPTPKMNRHQQYFRACTLYIVCNIYYNLRSTKTAETVRKITFRTIFTPGYERQPTFEIQKKKKNQRKNDNFLLK